MAHGRSWSENELEILKKNYPNKTLEELLELLPDRCHDGINSKARRIGLKKIN